MVVRFMVTMNSTPSEIRGQQQKGFGCLSLGCVGGAEGARMMLLRPRGPATQLQHSHDTPALLVFGFARAASMLLTTACCERIQRAAELLGASFLPPHLVLDALHNSRLAARKIKLRR